MTIKHFIAAGMLLIGLMGGSILATVSQRVRDIFFFLIVAMQLYVERVDVNFISAEWYRGSTRGFEISILDMLTLGVLIGSLLLPRHKPRLFWPASLGFMLLFVGFECFNVAASQPKLFGAFEVTKMLRAIIVFLAAAFYIRSERELRVLLLALAFAVCAQSVYALKQRLLAGMDRSPGTFDHPNSLSLYICTVAPMLVAGFNSRFPSWVRFILLGAIGAATMTILLTVSRAGIPVYALVMLGVTLATMSWAINLKKIGLICGFIAALAISLLLTWPSIKERYIDTSIADEVAVDKFENRGQYFGLAREILKDHSFGVGLNNWSYWVSKVYGPRTGTRYEDYDAIPPAMLQSPEMYDLNPNYAPPAHNLFVLTAGEMGWGGLVIFLILWLRWFSMGARFIWIRSSDPVLRIGTGCLFALGGMVLQSQTEWVYRQTTVMFTFYAILGTLASLYFMKRKAARAPKAEPVYAPPELRPLPAT